MDLYFSYITNWFWNNILFKFPKKYLFELFCCIFHLYIFFCLDLFRITYVSYYSFQHFLSPYVSVLVSSKENVLPPLNWFQLQVQQDFLVSARLHNADTTTGIKTTLVIAYLCKMDTFSFKGIAPYIRWLHT